MWCRALGSAARPVLNSGNKQQQPQGLQKGRASIGSNLLIKAQAAMPAAAGTAGAAPLAEAPASSVQPSLSRRVQSTDHPIVVQTKRLMAGTPGCMSLAQGIVYWDPPAEAVQAAVSMVQSDLHALSQYGADDGLPALRDALRRKLQQENGLQGYDVMVTAGANQAFTNVVLALLDESDKAALFKPIYFNHRMALQMTGGADRVVLGPRRPGDMHADLDWLERELAGPTPPKMVVITNPCNPTGVLMSREELQRAADLCGAAGAWLVMDNTYEHFCYDGRTHHCVGGPHVLHIFSFSKAWGMMGWRIGYIAYPEDGSGRIASELLKVQDTIPVCPSQFSQQLALGAIGQGRGWVLERVAALEPNRRAVLEALSPLGTLGQGVAGGEGAIYLWAKLPPGCEDDFAIVTFLVRKHKVCVIPGTSCGTPGHIRIAYANLPPEACAEAAARLHAGLEDIVAGGMASVREYLAAHS